MSYAYGITNGASTTLAAFFNTGDLTATMIGGLAGADGALRYNCVIEREIIGFTGCNGTVWTVVERGVARTTIVSHPLGAAVYNQLEGDYLDHLVAAYLNGTLVGTGRDLNVTGDATMTLVGDVLTLDVGAASGERSAADFRATGLTGATQIARFVGATTSGAPVSGTFAVGDYIVTHDGALWVCTVAGSPGTWGIVGSGLTNPMSAVGDLIVGTTAGAPARLPIGSTAQVLQVVSGAPAWAAPPSTFAGEVQAPDFKPTGLTGATQASRYAGATASGAPASGTFGVGDWIIDQTGKIWHCTTAGTPGTWVQVKGNPLFTVEVTTPDLKVSGLTGATAVGRLVGATASGAPASGTFAKGDVVIDQTGSLWICTTAGSPGTWVQSASGGIFSGEVQGTDFKATGLSGTTAACRLVGATSSGAPLSGTFIAGDAVVDLTGSVWICTVGGTPGTWVQVAGGLTNPMTTAGDLIVAAALGTPTRLGIGTDAYVLTMVSGAPAWAAAAGGAPSGAAGGDLDGSYPNPGVASIKGASVPGIGGNANKFLKLDSGGGSWELVAFGTASDTVTQGNDSRLSNARTPTAHETTHLTGGTDPIDWAGKIHDEGTHSGRPSAASGNAGYLYYETDTQRLFRSDGSSWVQVALGVADTPGGAPSGSAGGDLGATYPNPEVDGLQGDALATRVANGFVKRNGANSGWEEVAYGSAANTVTQGNDSRLSNARTPTGHHATHEPSGTDKIDWTLIVAEGVDGSKPAASSANNGTLYYSTDIQTLYRSNGTTWEQVAQAVGGSGPPSGTATGDLSGSYPDPEVIALQGDALPSVVANKFLKRNAANTAWELVGYSNAANTVTQGNDARLSDSRVPTSHASTHLPAQSDPIDFVGTVHAAGTHSGRPSAAAANSGLLYYETDTTTLFRSTGSAWVQIAAAASGVITNPMTAQDDIIVGGASGTPTALAKGSDSQVLTVDPTTHHLVWATPSAGAAYATIQDEGSALTQRSTLNIVGRGIVADDSGGVTRIRVSDPATMAYVKDDFFSGQSSVTGQPGELSWALSFGSVANQAGEANHPGIIRRTNTTGQNGTTSLISTILPADTFDCLWIFRPVDMSSDTTIKIGLMSGQGTPTVMDGVYLEGLSTDFSGGVMTWYLVTRASSSQTRLTSGVTTAANAWVKVRLRRIDASTVGCTVNAGTEVTQTLTIPTAVLGPAVLLAPTATRSIDLDFCDVLLTGLTR